MKKHPTAVKLFLLLFFVVQETGLRRQLWFQPYPEGEPLKISNDLNEYSSLSVTADGKSFGTTQDRPAAVICVVSRPEESQIWAAAFYFRNIAISPTRRYSSREDDPLAEAMRFLLDAQSSVQEVSL